MPFSFDTMFGLHEQSLLVHARRAQVLAANIANADTPNYKARDIDFREVMKKAEAGTGSDYFRLRTTSAGHIDAPVSDIFNDDLRFRMPSQPSIDGNTVETETEHAEFMENAVRYQASLQFLGGRIKKLLSAVRGE